MAAVNRRRRSGRRDWLRAGAASAGVGALLLAASLTGPQVGVAAADNSDESSVSASPADADDAGSPTESPAGAAGSAAEVENAQVEEAAVAERDFEDAEETVDVEGIDTDDPGDSAADLDADAEDVGAQLDAEGIEITEDVEDVEGAAAGVPAPAVATAEETPASHRVDSAASEIVDAMSDIAETESAASVTLPPVAKDAQRSSGSALVSVPGQGSRTVDFEPSRARPALVAFDPEVRRLRVAEKIEGFMSAAQALIAALPVDPGFRDWLSGALLLVRRTFLNQAPVVAPVQISGRVNGPIEGDLGAVDLEGDRVVYRLTQAPESGSVQIGPDGKYTYIPGPDFDGTDSFSVVARDVGLHFNVLDPFRRVATNSDVLVNQGAIKFEFIYGTGSQYWTPEAREALNASANSLTTYFLVKDPVTITYAIKGENSPDSDTLASAFSELISADAGYYPTVVQNKLLTGVDSNGSKADGEIEVNWAKSWALGESAGSDEYDFTSTIMHEAMHSFGFFSDLQKPGKNTDQNWPVFARFVVTSKGAKPIGKNFAWNRRYDKNLTGGNGGLYFGGKNAVWAYKKRVPLYTPNPWEQGSSMSHLNDSTFVAPNEQMMNANTDTGPGIRVLSAIEIGIMKDLGYTMVPQQPPAFAAVFVFVFFLRRTRPRPSVRGECSSPTCPEAARQE